MKPLATPPGEAPRKGGLFFVSMIGTLDYGAPCFNDSETNP